MLGGCDKDFCDGNKGRIEDSYGRREDFVVGNEERTVRRRFDLTGTLD